ncbi:hypothetical protein HYT23_00255 [Candidatus Pacearchaeota archaeon]|nr:hypothetical protein [Candidatus Pacearchaeota archaeon]
MRFNFRKISAIATSALMVGMTAGIAAAANYPAPFISGGVADVAVVMSTGTGYSALDHIEATNIFSDLQSKSSGTGGTTGTVTGEAFALFTGSSKVYINDSINRVKSTLTDSELGTTLADSDFEGDVSADVTQTITLGANPRLLFGKYPTSDDDPSLAVALSTTVSSGYIYNATINFNKAVNLTHSDSKGETITMFGQDFTIASATTATDLVLFKSSQEVSLSVGGVDPTSTEVTIEDKTYTVELTGATATTATVKVTDSNGVSEVKEVAEDGSKKIQGLDVAVKLASSSEATSTESATLLIGANRIELTVGAEIKVGSDEDTLDNTNVANTSGVNWGAISSFTIQVAAQDSDMDAIKAGGEYVDPVFGTFKINFAGLNIADDSTAREMIEIKPAGNDKANVKFMNHNNKEATLEWYYNVSSAAILADGDGDDFHVLEMELVNRSEYVVVGNEDEGYLLEVKTISNVTTGFADDEVKFQDAFDSTKTYDATITAEGTGTVTIGGKSYTVTYAGLNSQDSSLRTVRLNYPDSTASTTDAIIFPTIETSKGAKLAFYEPTTVDLDDWDGTNNLATLRFPDGDGYTDVAFTYNSGNTSNWTIGGTYVNTSDTTTWVAATIGQLTYNITSTGANETKVFLQDAAGTDNVRNPGIILFEEQDDSSSQLYNALIVKMGGLGTTTTPVTISDVEDTWSDDATAWNEIQTETDDDIYKSIDYYGTMETTDRSDTDSYVTTLSYPDEQVYPQLYVGEVSSAVTAGTSGSGAVSFNGVVVTDSEVGSVSGKNLIIVGGSCVNSAAATLVGGAYCGSDWTEATNVGTGQYLVKGYATNSLTSKLALLVAGYEKEDTVNAAKFLRTQTVDTSKAYIGTTSTTAEMQVETA